MLSKINFLLHTHAHTLVHTHTHTYIHIHLLTITRIFARFILPVQMGEGESREVEEGGGGGLGLVLRENLKKVWEKREIEEYEIFIVY